MNIVVLTIGRSGSTILTQMLGKLGWATPGADKKYAECVPFRTINEQILKGGYPYLRSRSALREFMTTLPEEPWVLKDPRLLLTLERWKPHLDNGQNCLVHLTRDHKKVTASLERMGWGVVRDGVMRVRGKTLDELDAIAAEHFANWTGPKISFSFEQMREAVGLFDLNRGM